MRLCQVNIKKKQKKNRKPTAVAKQASEEQIRFSNTSSKSEQNCKNLLAVEFRELTQIFYMCVRETE